MTTIGIIIEMGTNIKVTIWDNIKAFLFGRGIGMYVLYHKLAIMELLR